MSSSCVKSEIRGTWAHCETQQHAAVPTAAAAAAAAAAAGAAAAIAELTEAGVAVPAATVALAAATEAVAIATAAVTIETHQQRYSCSSIGFQICLCISVSREQHYVLFGHLTVSPHGSLTLTALSR